MCSVKDSTYSNCLINLSRCNQEHKNRIKDSRKTYKDLLNLLTDIEKKFQTFSPRYQANIFHSLAKLKTFFPASTFSSLLLSLSNTIHRHSHLSTFSPQDISMIVWALDKTGFKHMGLLNRFGHELVQRELSQAQGRGLDAFRPQELVTTIRSFAKLGVKNQRLCDRFVVAIIECDMNQFNSQGFANLVWAFARLGVQNQELFDVLAIELKHRTLRYFSSHEIENTLWAFATLNISYEGLYEQLASELCGRGQSVVCV